MKTIERALFPELKTALLDRRIVVLTGMRRVGKTTTLQWLLEQVNSPNKIYLDLERLDQRAVFKESNYDLVLDYLRNRGLDSSQPMTVALDEIQYAPNLPSVVKYLYDHYGIKFLLTGSSSFYLKNYFSKSMAGRKIVYEMFPLGFGEWLDFRTVPYRRRTAWAEMRFDPHEFERLKSCYDEYLTFGGLPDVVMEPDAQKNAKYSRTFSRRTSMWMCALWLISVRWANSNACWGCWHCVLAINWTTPNWHRWSEFLDLHCRNTWNSWKRRI